jgi:hypothetical protein
VEHLTKGFSVSAIYHLYGSSGVKATKIPTENNDDEISQSSGSSKRQNDEDHPSGQKNQK